MYSARYDSLQLQIVLNAVLAPFSAVTRLFDASEPEWGIMLASTYGDDTMVLTAKQHQR